MKKNSKPIAEFFPKDLQTYCLSFFKTYTFQFKIIKSRKTKLGDYRYHPFAKTHTITVNGDLNPYAFTITFLHEVAHLVTHLNHGRKVQPHGKEWKKVFGEILVPILASEDLPDAVRLALVEYIAQPKAASCSSDQLMKALREQDPIDDKMYLGDLHEGERFIFQERTFRIEKVAVRTRVTVVDEENRKKYLIHKNALVFKV